MFGVLFRFGRSRTPAPTRSHQSWIGLVGRGLAPAVRKKRGASSTTRIASLTEGALANNFTNPLYFLSDLCYTTLITS